MKLTRKTIISSISLQEGVSVITAEIKKLQNQGLLKNIEDITSYSRLLTVAVRGLRPVCKDVEEFRKYVRVFFIYHYKHTPECRGTMLEFVKLSEKLFDQATPDGIFARWVLKNQDILKTIAPFVLGGAPAFITIVALISKMF